MNNKQMSTNRGYIEIAGRHIIGSIVTVCIVATATAVLLVYANTSTRTTSSAQAYKEQPVRALETQASAGIRRCNAANLRVDYLRDAGGAAYVTPYGGAGEADMIMQFVNESASSCELTGAPTPEIAAANSARAKASVNVESSFNTHLHGQPAVQIFDTPVVVSPGKAAAFAMDTTGAAIIGFVPPGSTHAVQWSSAGPPGSGIAGGGIIITRVFPVSIAAAIDDVMNGGYPSQFATPYTTECSSQRGPGPTMLDLAMYEHWSSGQVSSLWRAYCNMLSSNGG
jgi:hypothetical protein